MDTDSNVCATCHSDCVPGKCLEGSINGSNSDKCTACSSATKYLKGLDIKNLLLLW